MIKTTTLINLKEGFTALVLGILLTFAFAPYDIYVLAVLAPAGLLGLWLKSVHSLKRTFWLGYSFGLGLFGAGVYWVFISIKVIGGVPLPLALAITAGMIAVLSFYPALTGYCLNRYFPINHAYKLLLAFPAVWVSFEWLRGWLFTGFPWLFLGYSQTNSPLKGYASLIGVYGISLALLISSGLLVFVYKQYQTKNYQKIVQSLVILGAIWGIGGLTQLIPWTKPTGKPLSIALVQGNIPQTIKWSPEHIQLSLDRYKNLTQPLLGKADIIIWPEAAIPLPLQNELASQYIDRLDEQVLAAKSHLLLGMPIMSEDGSGYYNALVTLGDSKQVYLKRHLVPFGEYTPFSAWFAKALQFMNVPMSDMLPGKRDQNLLNISGIHILPSICYEIAFPELTLNPDPNINLILVITNDAWFGQSNAQAQHLQMAAMRALEFQKPVVFVSNDGITATISPDGRIAKSIPRHEAMVLTDTVQPRIGITPWLKNGTDPIIFIILCFLFAAINRNRQLANAAQKLSPSNS